MNGSLGRAGPPRQRRGSDKAGLRDTGTFDGRGRPAPPPIQRNLVFRNLVFRNLARAAMVELATGPQLATQMGFKPLTEDQILRGNGGAVLEGLSDTERAQVVEHTPLWFHVLREAR